MSDQPSGPTTVQTAPTAPTPGPAPKSRKGLWIAIAIISILLLCCCASSGIAYFMFSGPNGDLGAFKKAENVYRAPYNDLVDYMASAGTGPLPTDSTTFFTKQMALATATRKGIAEARKNVADVSSSIKKTDYLSSLGAVDAALEKYENIDNAALNVASIASDIESAASIIDQANDTRAKALGAFKKSDYAATLAGAQESLDAYNKAKSDLGQLETQYPGVGISTINEYLGFKIELAQKMIEMAKAGQSGNSSELSAAATEYDRLVDEVNLAQIPALKSDPKGTLKQSVVQEAAAADKELEQAAKAHKAVYERILTAK